MMGTRTQYPVGQGCFHAGTLKWGKDPQQRFDYVYDCGANKSEPLERAIDAMVERLRVEDGSPVLDDLYISHLHEDHVNGLDQLLRRVQPHTVFIPYVSVIASLADLLVAMPAAGPSNALIEASLAPQAWFGARGVSRIVRIRPSNSSEEPSEDIDIDPSELPRGPGDGEGAPKVFSMKSGEMLSPGAHGQSLDWVLVSHVDPEVDPGRFAAFGECVAGVLGVKNLETDLTPQTLIKALRNKGKRQELKDCYKNHFKGGHNHNRVSMSLYSGPRSIAGGQRYTPWHTMKRKKHIIGRLGGNHPVAWIATGDAKLKDDEVWEAWQKCYEKFLPNVVTLLLPHHGSEKDFHEGLLTLDNLVWCLAAAGDPSPYPHPGISVIESVRHDSKGFRHVSEDPDTEFREEFHVG